MPKEPEWKGDQEWIKIPQKPRVAPVPVPMPRPKVDEGGNVVRKQKVIAQMLREKEDSDAT